MWALGRQLSLNLLGFVFLVVVGLLLFFHLF